MGLEHNSPISKLLQLQGCPGNICGTFAGDAIAPLLAASDECAQQDMADRIIDAAKNLSNGITSSDTRNQMIITAMAYREAEKNTLPIYPDLIPRNSVYCQKPPKNSELKGLVQKQDPANGPLLFFDHLVHTNGSTVLLDSQPNTRPFGEKAGSPPATGTKLKQSDITSSSSTDAKSTPVDPNPKHSNNAIRTSSVDEGEGNGSCDDAEEEK
ncbi:hypothetical protein PtA15_11A534 [Puccinia triticina]|uniref:Uncharacterized protein n=1 Tax=Puccinia triticina TaxID=208348 RepID=A0ABY7CZI7_9BASI|nr:uncharacterized protein PtA15_11A534 [Puccinia triticina]WAQ89842.1 hypothetical protein PtA15_11A534 [Puccinia triticina]